MRVGGIPQRKEARKAGPSGLLRELVRSREVAESSGSAIPSVGAGTSPALTAKGNFHRSPHRRGADRRSRLAFLMSVAVAIDVGGISALLGADLENSADDNRGWGAILTDKNLPTNQSIIFKIPHHGSQNAHHAEVWQTLLCKDPISIVTPWRRGGRELPTTSDVGRIRAHSPHAFMTSSTDAALSKINRPQIVRRQLREMGARIERMYGTEGVIRIRNGGPPDWHSWDVCLRDGASVL